MIERKVFEDHFRNCFGLLARYANIFVRDREQAKEIVQEVFTALWEKRNSLNIACSLQVYLYQAVKNRSLNYVRDSKKNIFINNVPDLVVEDEEEELPMHSLEEINVHLHSLPSRCREIFIMKRLRGLSYKQIGIQLNISEKSVENQMTIAFRKLREVVNMKSGHPILKNDI